MTTPSFNSISDDEIAERVSKLKAAGVVLKGSTVPGTPFICERGPVTIGDAEIGPWNCLGRFSYINSGFIRKGVEIGRFCSLGRSVTIGTGTHDMEALTTSPVIESSRNLVKYADPDRRKTVVIGHDVWVGDHVIVMTGVTIGTGAVIAAGSIVTKDIAPYAIVGGNYARPIGRRTRFAAEISERLLASKWWEIPLKVIREAPSSSPVVFLDWLDGNEGGFQREAFLTRKLHI